MWRENDILLGPLTARWSLGKWDGLSSGLFSALSSGRELPLKVEGGSGGGLWCHVGNSARSDNLLANVVCQRHRACEAVEVFEIEERERCVLPLAPGVGSVSDFAGAIGAKTIASGASELTHHFSFLCSG